MRSSHHKFIDDDEYETVLKGLPMKDTYDTFQQIEDDFHKSYPRLVTFDELQQLALEYEKSFVNSIKCWLSIPIILISLF